MTDDIDRIEGYDYELPAELIAEEPPARRGDSRLMLLDRERGAISHHRFAELPELLDSGDRLVFNDSRVLPARLRGYREATGGKWEGLFLAECEEGDWRVLSQTRGTLRPGERVLVRSAHQPERVPLRLVLVKPLGEGAWRMRPESADSAFAILQSYGDVPLPPYIRKGVAHLSDAERYQTVYARAGGSVAAPTAGLHFTEEAIGQCRRRGLTTSFLTLHVGLGTFRPITSAHLDEHVMHAEYAELSPEVAADIQQTQTAGGRVVAVGTTSVRVVESAAGSGGIGPFAGETSLFIRPPYHFGAVDALLTNFHLPRSTLLVLVSALAGRDLIQQAYAEAIAERYRFYSYGDAMLIR